MPRYEFARQRLHVAGRYAADGMLPLTPEQQNYLVNVLRMEEGAKLLVFNGLDGEWHAELVRPTRKGAALRLIAQVRPQTPAAQLLYAFAPLKSARLDYMVQKAVEMGAGALQPVITRRSQVSRLKPERLLANAIEAAEQCGILTIPDILPEMRLAEWLAHLPGDTLLVFADEDAAPADPVTALQAAEPAARIALIVGPEGGFEPEERARLVARPLTCRISLGPRILRADTAAVAALAAIQIALGDWRQGECGIRDASVCIDP